MKILHIITSLAIGGAEKLMVDLLPRLQQRGCSVDLFVLDGHETPFMQELRKANINVIISAIGESVYNPRHILRLRRIIGSYDIVHSHNYSPQLFAAIASIEKKVILCTTEHSSSNRRRSLFWFRPIDKWMYQRYHKIICISDQTEENLRKHLRTNIPTIQTIYNGVDIQKYAQAYPSDEIQSKFLGKKVISMVAGFRAAKDHKTLIESMRYLPIDYHLLLVGTGITQEDYKDYVKQLKLGERVHFLGARIDIPNILKASTVKVISSHWEGFGLVSVEAMAAEIPVIASDVPGLSTIVGNAGILFPKGDAKSLAHEIQRACEDIRWRESLILRGKERAKQFDIETMTYNYYQLYLSFSKINK